MAALRVFALGLAVAHVAWLWFWLSGSLVRPPRPRYVRSEDALLDLVLSSVTGIALTGLATFALGLCGALVPVTPLVAVAGLAFALVLRGDSPFERDFWVRRSGALRGAASPGALIVYAMALVLALPAIVPDIGSDATSLYLAQALDYAGAHRLAVDPWLRFPYYPNNWVLIETWPAVLRLGSLGQFVNWLCGCLTLLGVYGSIVYGAREAQGAAGMRGIRGIAIAAVTSLALTAMFLKVLDVGMLDVPAMTFFLAILIAVLSGVREPGSGALASLVLCAGYLVGVKISFVALLPLFSLLCWIVPARTGGYRRPLSFATLALLAVASPWYIRSFVLAGDPIAPVLNLRLRGVDPHFSRDDLQRQLDDLRADSKPRALLVLPFQLFADFDSRGVRDFGTTLIAILLPLPSMYVGWALCRRRFAPTTLLISAACVTYGYGYWVFTSHLGRYALLFLPCLIVFVALLVARCTAVSVPLRYAGAALMCVFACPSPASWNATLLQTWQLMAGVGLYFTGADTWLELRSPAYAQIEDVAHAFQHAGRPDLRVYLLELSGAQYFSKQHGLTMLGDAFGPDRFTDFGQAVLRGELKPYAERFDIGAFIVPEYLLEDVSPKYIGLTENLRALGWRESRYPGSVWLLYTAPNVPQPRRGEGHPLKEALL